MYFKLVAFAAALLASTFIAAAPSPSDLSGPMPPPENQTLAHNILRDIVAVHSVHAVGTKQVADIIVKYLKAGGLADSEIHELGDPKYPNQMNVVVRLKGKGQGKPVMWICHMDVVEAKASDWTKPPFTLTEEGNYFYGRGTSDMKDEDAAMAASLIRLKKEGYVPDRDLIVAFTADEEVGLEQDGPAWLLKAHPELVNAGVVLNPDQDSGEIVGGKRMDFGVETSQKIYVTFLLSVANRGGHSSEPRPDNAIYQLADGLVKLSHFQFPVSLNATTRLYFQKMAQFQTGQRRTDYLAVSQAKPDPAAAAHLSQDTPLNALLRSTCVATMLSGGHQENALAQLATATVQCRIMPNETPEGTGAAIARVVGPGIQVKQLAYVVHGPESPPDAALFARFEKVVHGMWGNVPVIPSMMPGASDSLYTRSAGIPSYGIAGTWSDPEDDRTHGKDERREKGAFYQSVEFAYRLMKEMGSGK
ncbi:MAG TPA: M20/M25/M40 family metallo-hydrolase [Rhizomicrobium sp.]|jgi:acetylornithine deacetylase/succinyl-diaminopimelate desuccinylase-like protein